MREDTMDAEKELEAWLEQAGEGGAGAESPSDPLLRALDSAFGGQPQPQAVRRALARLRTEVAPQRRLYYDVLPRTAVGPISVALSEAGLVAVEFGRPEEGFLQRLQRSHKATPVRSPERARPVLRQLAEYLQGKRQAFQLDVDLSGVTPFQRQVLRAAAQVPRGGLVTYAEIARHIGKPRASRAVGQALAHNPVPIVIPCHRVVAADGSLTGYSGGRGIETKAQLLRLEGAFTR